MKTRKVKRFNENMKGKNSLYFFSFKTLLIDTSTVHFKDADSNTIVLKKSAKYPRLFDVFFLGQNSQTFISFFRNYHFKKYI